MDTEVRAKEQTYPPESAGRSDCGCGLRILCYTIALDRPGSTHYRQQARLLVSSLLGTGSVGNIKIRHNGKQTIFAHPRRGAMGWPPTRK